MRRDDTSICCSPSLLSRGHTADIVALSLNGTLSVCMNNNTPGPGFLIGMEFRLTGVSNDASFLRRPKM